LPAKPFVEPGFNFFPWNSVMGVFLKVSNAAVEFGGLFGSQFEGTIFFPDHFSHRLLLGWRQVFDLFEDFRRAHGVNLLLCFVGASWSFSGENFFIFCPAFRLYPWHAMTLNELLESVRRVEVRTSRLVNAGQNFNSVEFDGIRNDNPRRFAQLKP
jgi:hypothetical protein